MEFTKDVNAKITMEYVVVRHIGATREYRQDQRCNVLHPKTRKRKERSSVTARFCGEWQNFLYLIGYRNGSILAKIPYTTFPPIQQAM